MYKRWKYMFAVAAAVLLLAGCGQKEVRPQEVSSDLEVHYLDVGQGDATLITSNGHAMLIDAGNNDRGEEVQGYLESKGIRKLDYVVGTHPDADHVGGLDVILQNFEVGEILLPDVSKDTRTYEEVLETAEQKGKEIQTPASGEQFSLGETRCTIVAPNGTGYESVNDYSIGILLEHGKNRFLFVGDAEEESEQEMLEAGTDIRADVYKVSHHGSKTGTTEEFLDAVDPEYAVISCGESNSYGHPHAEILNRLRMKGIAMYRTDEQGTVTAISDGEEIRWNMSPSDDWAPGEPKGSQGQTTREQPKDSKSQTTWEQPKDGAKTTTYVLNKNTKKFHFPDCSSAADIKEENREEVQSTKNEMIKKGYSPCKNCMD